MFEPQDRIISMEVRQTDMRQGVDTFVVSAVSVDGVPKSHQFLTCFLSNSRLSINYHFHPK